MLLHLERRQDVDMVEIGLVQALRRVKDTLGESAEEEE